MPRVEVDLAGRSAAQRGDATLPGHVARSDHLAERLPARADPSPVPGDALLPLAARSHSSPLSLCPVDQPGTGLWTGPR